MGLKHETPGEACPQIFPQLEAGRSIAARHKDEQLLTIPYRIENAKECTAQALIKKVHVVYGNRGWNGCL